jgi:site-specific DNA-cytosine methylase
MKHAAIIPLIGGEILSSDEIYETKPEYILSYSGFMNNEKHLINYYKSKGYDVPYHILDKVDFSSLNLPSVDIVSSTCPCAGLSNYHHAYGEENQNNQWMEKTTQLILNEVKPKVMWGENAPALATNVGKFMKDKLMKIADDAGYNMSIYLTKSLNHGVPQIRRRTFYFFWKRDFFDNSIPIFEYYSKEPRNIRDLILNINTNFQTEVIEKKIPSKDDLYYRYFLEEVKGGMTHKEFCEFISKDETYTEPFFSIEYEMVKNMGITYEEIGEWMKLHGTKREVDRCERRHKKLTSGQNVMWRGTVVPVRHIGAFVVHMPYVVTHPLEDRYLNYREAMTIMGLPQDFELLDPEKSVNHICQNVPYDTARDMAIEVKAVMEGKRKMERASYVLQDNLSKNIREMASNHSILDFM